MNDLNQCQFIGRLGREVESRQTATGEAIANFSLACNSRWRDKTSGEKKESVEWIHCTAFGKLAEICATYLIKGAQVFVSGRLKTETWRDSETLLEKRSTRIVVEQMQMLGGRTERAGAASGAALPNSPDADVPF